MLDFRMVTLADKATIESFVFPSLLQNCDLSFANIYSWRFLYQTSYTVHNGFLLFRFYANHHLAYMAPIGQGNMAQVIEAMREDAAVLGHPFFMLGVNECIKIKLEQQMPDVFVFREDRDFFDYIYDREIMETLKGKKMQAKRNHINKFESLYPDFRFLPLTDDLIPRCLELEEQWFQNSEEEERFALLNERRSMTDALKHRAELGLSGGVLLVGDTLIAFTYGAPINANTFDVCVEKADTTYQGAYAMVNRCFVSSLPSQYRFINREEDLGLSGLRHSKLSYHPALLLKKYSISDIHPYSLFNKLGLDAE